MGLDGLMACLVDFDAFVDMRICEGVVISKSSATLFTLWTKEISTPFEILIDNKAEYVKEKHIGSRLILC